MQKQNDFIFDTSRPIDLICMGRVAVDLYSEQIDTPLNESQSFNKYLGGCAGNIAVGTSRQGLKSAMFSCVGTDEMGTFLKNTLIKEGVNITLLNRTPKHLTALVMLGVCPPDHFPLIFYRENCADMQIKPEHCDIEFLKKAKALLITGTNLSTPDMRESTYHAVNLAKSCGTKIIIDLDYRPVLWKLTDVGDGETRFQANSEVSKQYAQILAKCDLIIGTEEEVAIASGYENMPQAIEFIHKLTPAPIVLKTGEKGCEVYLKNASKPLPSKPFKVDVFNVLGAGDAFMSGLLGALLKGKSWDNATTYANVCGAIVVTRHGCAPAIPSYDEATYFIENYQVATVNKLINSQELSLLHDKVVLGSAAQKPLALLAYDHRWQFEESCNKYDQPYTKIAEFKEAVFAGFKEIYSQQKASDLGIIIDPEYGHNVIKEAAFMQINICTPVETSGTESLHWIDGVSAYSSLVNNSPAWTVKVLWKYHPEMSEAFKAAQLEKLNELYAVCKKLDRRLMLELIIPEEYHLDGKSLAGAMRDVYTHEIYPFWWKLQSLENAEQWQFVDKVIDQYDSSARIIILGGAAKNLNDYASIFKKAKQSHYLNGFALGRSIFWDSWQKYISNEITQTDVIAKIAENYKKVLQIWREV